MIALNNVLIKDQAHALKAFLSNNGTNLSLSSAYQALAIMYGYKDWNTLKSLLDKENTK